MTYTARICTISSPERIDSAKKSIFLPSVTAFRDRSLPEKQRSSHEDFELRALLHWTRDMRIDYHLWLQRQG